MSLKRALLATALVSAPLLASISTASAQPVTGLYIGVGAGANWVNNPAKVDLSGDVLPGNFGLAENTRINNVGKLNFDLGWTGVASIGWGFGNGFRAEIDKEAAADKFTYAELEENDEDLTKLRGWFDKVRLRDSLGARRRAAAEEALQDCVAALDVFADQVYLAEDGH